MAIIIVVRYKKYTQIKLFLTLLDSYFEEAQDTIDKVIESRKNLVGSTAWKEFKVNVNNYESLEFNA